MAKKKKTSRAGANTGTTAAGAKRPNIGQSKKALVEVKKDLRKARRPLYELNRKIKDAPNRYQANKLKKQKKQYEASIEPRLLELTQKRTELNSKIKIFHQAVVERTASKRKLKSIQKKIDAAEENQDWDEVKRLRYLEVKELSTIDKLSELAGIELKKTKLEDFDREEAEDEGGKDYELDQKSPYSIWEAVKQLEQDINVGGFKFFIINGKRLSADSPIQILAEGAVFWVSIKKRREGTPYVNRYLNHKNNSVKYKYYNS